MEDIQIMINNHHYTGNNPILETMSCCESDFVTSDDKLVPFAGHNDQHFDHAPV